MLGPFLDWLTKSTVGLYASIVGTYQDSIYESAAKGLHEEHSLVVHTVVIALLPFLYYYLLRRHPTHQRDPNEAFRLFIRSRSGYWFLMFLTVAMFFGTAFASLRLRHVNETITYSLSSFEIVRPIVGEARYVDLRARFYSMRTASEFQTIYVEVTSAAKRGGRALPLYDPL
jgi:hypothetical protein